MTAQTTAAVSLEPEAVRSLVLTRLIDAPPDLVFRAFTAPEHLARWWGPQGFSITTQSFDFRPGGVWRLVMHAPGGRDFRNRVVFDVIEPSSRIVSHHEPEPGDEIAGHQTRITLTPEGDKTRLEWRLVFASAAELERIAREYGAEQGMIETVGRLAAYATEL